MVFRVDLCPYKTCNYFLCFKTLAFTNMQLKSKCDWSYNLLALTMHELDNKFRWWHCLVCVC
jgi:hypothetical protein